MYKFNIYNGPKNNFIPTSTFIQIHNGFAVDNYFLTFKCTQSHSKTQTFSNANHALI